MEKLARLLGLAMKARMLAVGSRETREGLRRGEVRLVLLAEDGSPRDGERLRRIAAEGKVPVLRGGSRLELGGTLGRGAVAVVGVKDANLAKAVRRDAADADTSRKGRE
ncbi:MAG: L7Ae/L30e/S12e/Gadd45 family ribosomal protein [Gemmatimonadota bacterium]|nr:L7Ae/L30e/S12e/Gadd45 family ribosomal protein [Gemmatimonadota bacterium]MDP6529664.1 L7Ae/L30e/S12e/Gadd45 family ribosomal protein [Gemmatimonadota bacterium]MDP6802264.1 L7Ae/L30e/S12e/Gadd45 family ribosomal protein [Gemmatimonadota bacterium]MDP7031541.1 L7Ae/L30e/S12e/Gadd45 family ribosomal protein [Gemmatimonadota bacterium]